MTSRPLLSSASEILGRPWLPGLRVLRSASGRRRGTYSSPCKVGLTCSSVLQIASEALKGRVFEVSLADLQKVMTAALHECLLV